MPSKTFIFSSALVLASLSVGLIAGCEDPLSGKVESGEKPETSTHTHQTQAAASAVNSPATAPASAPTTEPSASASAGGGGGHMGGEVAPAALGEVHQAEDLSFQLPAGWTITRAQGMRYATITAAGGAEVTVTRFPGAAGGVLDNINRWRGQIMLPPITQEQLHTVTMNLPLKGTTATFTMMGDPNNEAAPRLLAAIVPAGELTYYFKMMGPKAQLAQNELSFISMVKSVQLKQ